MRRNLTGRTAHGFCLGLQARQRAEVQCSVQNRCSMLSHSALRCFDESGPVNYWAAGLHWASLELHALQQIAYLSY